MRSLTRRVEIQVDEEANAAVIKFGPRFPSPPDVRDVPIEMNGNVIGILTTSVQGQVIQLELLMADRQLGDLVDDELVPDRPPGP